MCYNRSMSDYYNDRLWFAGFFEADGYVSKEQCVIIDQKDPDVLYKVQDIFGGSIVKLATRNLHRYRLGKSKSVDLLRSIYPFMSPRRKGQIEAKIEVLLKFPSLDMSDLQFIVWLSGIIEGDGSISPDNGTERISITQKDRWLLDKIQKRLGGTVYKDRTKHNISLYGKRARGVLQSIYELMSPRRQEQIKKTMRWQTLSGCDVNG